MTLLHIHALIFVPAIPIVQQLHIQMRHALGFVLGSCREQTWAIPMKSLLLVSFLHLSDPSLLQETEQEGAHGDVKGHQPARRGSEIT